MIAAIYIVLNLILTAIATWVQKKFVGEKKVLEVPMVGEGDPTAVVPKLVATCSSGSPRAGSRPR